MQFGDSAEVLIYRDYHYPDQLLSINTSTGGDDTINAGDGDNVVVGGAENDIIITGKDNDIVVSIVYKAANSDCYCSAANQSLSLLVSLLTVWRLCPVELLLQLHQLPLPRGYCFHHH